jgi:hypothetical protein
MTIKRRLAMTNKKGAMTRCHCEEVRQATDDEAIPKLVAISLQLYTDCFFHFCSVILPFDF